MQAKGLRILPYLGDWLACARTRERALHDTAALLSHVTQLGLTVSYSKSSLTPNQAVVFLGMALDYQQMIASPSLRWVDDMLHLLRRAGSCRIASSSG